MPEPPRRVTTEDGSEVVVHDLGGAGPTLLMAHATGFSGRVFTPLADELAGRFNCLAIDHRAHGDAVASGEWPGDWRGFAEDVLSVVDELSLRRPVGFGHSAGGAALLLAEEARPGTFESLYLFEPVVWPEDDGPGPSFENPLSARAMKRRESFTSFDEARTTLSAKPPFSAFAPAVVDAYIDSCLEELSDGSVRLKCRPADEARVYAYGRSHHAYTRLGDVDCPVTLACGEKSDFITEELLTQLAARLRRRKVEVFVGLDHFGPFESPARLAEAICRAQDTPPA